MLIVSGGEIEASWYIKALGKRTTNPGWYAKQFCRGRRKPAARDLTDLRKTVCTSLILAEVVTWPQSLIVRMLQISAHNTTR